MPGSPEPLFHVVLHQPEIPNNTGNIGRTCVALASELHLVRPIAFDLGEKAVRRAGLDYWPRLRLRDHASWPDYRRATDPARRWYFSTGATVPLWDAEFRLGDHLIFGSETRGLPDHVLAEEPDRWLTLPMVPTERSLNLATAACTVLYEALRQCRERGEVTLDAGGRLEMGGQAPAPAANPGRARA